MDTISALPPPSAPPPQAPPPPPPQAPPTRHSWLDVPIARDRDHRKIGGVIAGVSAAYGFDRRTTRIAVAIGALVVPGLVALYIAAMIFLPNDAAGAMSLRQIVADRRRRPLMIVLGIVALATGFGSWSFFGGVGWGFALVAAGVLLWLMPNLGDFEATEPAPGAPTTGVPAPPYATSSATPGARTGSHTAPRRRRHPIQAIGLAAASFGVLVAGIGNSAEWWDVTTYGVVLGALITLVVATVVGAIVNHSWFGIPMLVVLSAGTLALVVAHPNLDGGLGDRTFRPTTLAEADDDHQLGVGRLTLDLRDVPFGEQPLRIEAGVGFGQLRVMVPDDVEVVLTSDLNAGHVVVNGDEVFDGVRRDDTLTVPARGEGQHHTLVLDASIGAGELDVRQTG